MKDSKQQIAKATADTAEAEKEQAATPLGNFENVQALMDAYKALQAEFTRRSQRLKELEANMQSAAPAQDAAIDAQPSPTADDGNTQSISQEVKNAVIEEYLCGVCKNRGVPIITGGGAVTAQRRTPQTLKEAGALASKLFYDKEDK